MSSGTFVSEDRREQFARDLNALREGSLKEAKFPSDLTVHERKFIHKHSEQLGLISKSYGKGENRYITVKKREKSANNGEKSNNNNNNNHEENQRVCCVNFQDETLNIMKQLFSTSIPNNKNSMVKKKNVILKKDQAKGNREDLKISSEDYQMKQLELSCNRGDKYKEEYSKLQAQRSKLPAFQYKNELVSLIRDNQILLISGSPGSGKSTQVPQYILDDEVLGGENCRICVTQPRRVSAISVATRVCQERVEQVGDITGYNVRLDKKVSNFTQLTFLTPGVLLRKLQTPTEFNEYNIIIIDEAHERDYPTEFALMVLRDLCLKRRDIRLILMSATMHTQKLSSYFGDIKHVSVGGACYPVEELHLDDVLRVTNYTDGLNLGGADTTEGGNAGGSSMVQGCVGEATKSSYNCIMCGEGPFLTPIELGTHAALCTGASSTSVNNDNNNNKNNNNKSNNKGKGKNNELNQQEKLKRLVKNISSNLRATLLTDGDLDSDVRIESIFQDEGPSASEDMPDFVTIKDPGLANHANQDTSSSNLALRHYQSTHDDTQVDYNLMYELLIYISTSEYFKDGGSVLCFLPGWEEISSMKKLLTQQRSQFNDRGKNVIILPLHSCISKEQQMEIFKPIKSSNDIKIILSTNIAETSITIPDVSVVIDSGRQKEKFYDPYTKLCYLKGAYISKSSAMQRKGRAGRVKVGVIFRLYSKKRYQYLPDFEESELSKTPLENLLLQIQSFGLCPGKGDDDHSIKDFLGGALDPPKEISINHAIKLLKRPMNCFDEKEQITSLGVICSQFPLEPQVSRTILLGCLFGCATHVLQAACIMCYRDPFLVGQNDEEKIRINKTKYYFSKQIPSDVASLLNIYNEFLPKRGRDANMFCKSQFLSMSTMIFVRDFIKQMKNNAQYDVGIQFDNDIFNRNNRKNEELALMITAMGLYPNIAVRYAGSKAFTTESGRKAKIHSSSVLHKSLSKKVQEDDVITIVSYQNMIEGMQSFGRTNLSMLNCSYINPTMFLLCCRDIEEKPMITNEEDAEYDYGDGIKTDIVHILVDNWVDLTIERSSLTAILNMRDFITQSLLKFAESSKFGKHSDKEKMDKIGQILMTENAFYKRTLFS